MQWIYIENQVPTEGQYVLVKCDIDSPVGISRVIDGEWDTGNGRRRPVFTNTERFMTSASINYWMPLPYQPERVKRSDTEDWGNPITL
jgi:hypothetical protein